MRDTEKEAETQAEGEAGSLQGARCRTWIWDPGVTPWAQGRCQTAAPPRDPWFFLFDGMVLGSGLWRPCLPSRVSQTPARRRQPPRMVIRLVAKLWLSNLVQLLLQLLGFFFTLILFYFFRFYWLIHERHRERWRHRQREKQAPCREPDAGLDPRTPGSRPELKADAQPLSHSGTPTGRI